MARAYIIVLDSVGCGGASDAASYGDLGADTLGHIAAACAAGQADTARRRGPLRIPVLDSLGIGIASSGSTGSLPPGLSSTLRRHACAGHACEISYGKDTPSGHWEIAGAPLQGRFGYFSRSEPVFPPDLVEAIVMRGRLPGLIGLRHAAGVALIEELGEEHVATGKPIVYTSADSVIQIAAHEDAFGRERLYELCQAVRELVDPLAIGRVIARPFVGSSAQTFRRSPHRRDYPLPAPAGNILDMAAAMGREVVSVGKVADIFGHRNTGTVIKGRDDMDLFDRMLPAANSLAEGGLLFANFVDLDTDYGHRRDVAGYAEGLERLDARLGEFLPLLREGDICVITADHGNDPTWTGSDHTRENVPVLQYCPGAAPSLIGGRPTFADVGATVARHLDLPATPCGSPWIRTP